MPLFFEVKMIEAHEGILNWFAREARSFPWRYDNPEPYHVLISEYMLQQTQTTRIAERFPEFISQFHDIEHLGKATNQEIILAWQGLGYNNRALRLRDCARQIITLHKGVIPHDYDALIALPGIGPYTASAILSFAYGEDVPVIDVNIYRIYARVLGNSDPIDANKSMITSFAESAFPKGHSSAWHQAMMDIGARWCKANQALCTDCPLQTHCKSAFNVQMITKKKEKKEPSHRNIPNRIWRGKTVEHLRNCSSFSEKKEILLNIILSDHANKEDTQWFEDIIIHALVRDRLIEYDIESDIISIAS